MIGVDLRDAGDRTELESAAIIERDRGAFVWNNSLRRVDDRLEHAIETERRSDFVADGVQRLEDFDFALGHQEAGVVERVRRRSCQADQDEEIVVVEGFAFGFVDGLDATDERFAIHHGDSDQRANAIVAGVAIALDEPGIALRPKCRRFRRRLKACR